MMKIYWNAALNVPLGKKVAQLGHGVGAVVLGDGRVREGSPWNGSFELINTDQGRFEKIQGPVSIVDAGHTVFGEPTLTVKVELDEEGMKHWDPLPHKNTATDIRMVMVVRAGVQKKKNFLQEGVMAWREFTRFHVQQNQKIPHEAFKVWSQGSFAKIVLRASEQEWGHLMEKIGNPVKSKTSKEERMQMLGQTEGLDWGLWGDDQFEIMIAGPAHKKDLESLAHLKLL